MNRLASLSRCACLLLALALLPAHVARARDTAPPSLIPLPAQLTLQHGGFTVDVHTPVVLASHDAATKQTADYLIDLMARTRGLHLRLADDDKTTHAIVLQRDPLAPVAQAEGYALDVTPEGIRVTMVRADHSCGISDGDQILYGGVAAGYIVRLPGGIEPGVMPPMSA